MASLPRGATNRAVQSRAGEFDTPPLLSDDLKED